MEVNHKIKHHKIYTITAIAIAVIVSCSFNKKEQDTFKTIPIHLQKDSLFLGMWGFNNNLGEPLYVLELYIKNYAIQEIFYDIKLLKIVDTSYWTNYTNDNQEIVKIKNNFFWGDKPIDQNLYYAISVDSSCYVFSNYHGNFKQDNRGIKFNYVNEIIDKYWAYINYCRKNDSTTIARWYSDLILARLYKENDTYMLMHTSNYSPPEVTNVKLFQKRWLYITKRQIF